MDSYIVNEEWVPTGSHTRCPNPECRSVPGLHVKLFVDAFGSSWRYRCFSCGATGPAKMKTPEEKGRWVEPS